MMEKPIENKKIREEVMNRADSMLGEIMAKIADYNTFFHTMTPQEQAAIGGIVYHAVSIWSDKSLIGATTDRPHGATMINNLVGFFNNPTPRQPHQNEGGIIQSDSGSENNRLPN